MRRLDECPAISTEIMTDAPSLTTLAQWLSGEFSNQAQALNEPTWFVKLRLWHRPIPTRLGGHLAIFAEQANALYPEQSYRQRVFALQEHSGMLQAQYFGFKQPERFKGAGIKPELLNRLTLDDLEQLPGCVLEITYEGDGRSTDAGPRFLGRMRLGDRCQFRYQEKSGQEKSGQEKVGQVILGFDVSVDQFLSYDKGVDPETEKPIWGALMGPYVFAKVEDFSADLPR